MATEWIDDDALLLALGAALAEENAVPAGIADAGRDVYGWRTVDAELIALTHDSALAAEQNPDQSPALVRGDRPARRSLSFDSARLRIDVDVEYEPDALRGQVTAGPDQSGLPDRLVVEVVGAPRAEATLDEVGYFTIEPFAAARGVFRLRCGDVVTPWIT